MIIGPSGCGKTTLGRQVAEMLGYPYFDVDEYIWRFDTPELYTVMYSREEKIVFTLSGLFQFSNIDGSIERWSACDFTYSKANVADSFMTLPKLPVNVSFSPLP